LLTALLRQNPRFVTDSDGPAQAVFADLVARYAQGGPMADLLKDDQKIALWRNVIGAVHHRRAANTVVFDNNVDWLPYVDLLVRLYPLSRFILCVRNPAFIANTLEIERDTTVEGPQDTETIEALMGADGPVGRPIADLREALSSRHAERMFVLDYDRLADDPDEVLDVLYDFLREPGFSHDFNNIGSDDFVGPVRRSTTPMVLTTRTILRLSGRAFWRNLRRTSATMMLGRGR